MVEPKKISAVSLLVLALSAGLVAGIAMVFIGIWTDSRWIGTGIFTIVVALAGLFAVVALVAAQS